MRRRIVTLTFAAMAIVTGAAGAAASGNEQTSVMSAPRVAVQHLVSLPGLRDEASMVLVGTALIFLGAAVRRVG